uniref:Uncharacterized protein n=1 Tax=Arundo donax TaxID=35708 RepID=A0A0A9HDG3_ARUDO
MFQILDLPDGKSSSTFAMDFYLLFKVSCGSESSLNFHVLFIVYML